MCQNSKVSLKILLQGQNSNNANIKSNVEIDAVEHENVICSKIHKLQVNLEMENVIQK